MFPIANIHVQLAECQEFIRTTKDNKERIQEIDMVRDITGDKIFRTETRDLRNKEKPLAVEDLQDKINIILCNAKTLDEIKAN